MVEKAEGGAAWRAVMKLKELMVDRWPQVRFREILHMRFVQCPETNKKQLRS